MDVKTALKVFYFTMHGSEPLDPTMATFHSFPLVILVISIKFIVSVSAQQNGYKMDIVRNQQ